MGILRKAQTYAISCHSMTNHFYDGKPYLIHLKMVYEYAYKFRHLLYEDELLCHPVNVLAAAWTHDTIEDTRQTYNDVKKILGSSVAELTYALTNEKGRNRKERANDKYYEDMRKVPGAVYLKICDRLANAKYSKMKGSKMLEVYKKEYLEFAYKLASPTNVPMFDELRKILFQ